MYNPIKLELVNFLSHPHSVFHFNNDSLTLIFGKNEDDKEEGADSNGSGKSAIIEGITTALTGTPYRDVNKDDFIMDDQPECWVKIWLDNPILNEKLRIEWKFSRKSDSKTYIYLNDNKDYEKELTSINEAKKFIISKLGVSKEDLLNFFIINQDDQSSFFTSGDAKQKEIISRFANYTKVQSVLSTIEKEKSDVEKEIQNIERDLDKLKAAKAEYEFLLTEELELEQNSIEEETRPFLEEIDENLNEIDVKKANLIKSKNIVSEAEEKLQELTVKLEEFEQYDLLKKQINKEIEEVETKISSLKIKERNTKRKIDSAIECPACKHNFIHEEHDEDVSELKKLLVKIQANLGEENERWTEKNQELTLLKEILDKKDKIQKEFQIQKSKINSGSEDQKVFNRTIKQLEDRNSLLQKKIENLLSVEKPDSKASLYKEKIQAFEDKIVALEPFKKTKEVIIEEKNFWIHHLGKKGFQTFLANKCIQAIEHHCNVYLSKMGSNLSVKINGYTKIASGELRDKIEIFILKNGVSQGKYAKYSGGQKERVNLAGIYALHKLINGNLNGRGLNLLCLDESLDHLDVTGQKICLEILKKFKTTNLVITHGSAESILDGYNKTVVSYKDRKSRII